MFAATNCYGQEAEGQENVTATSVALDDGSGPAGDLIIPKAMAMRCGISSKDGRDKEKLDECFDTLASEGADIFFIQKEMMHQISKDALEKALTVKSAAGNYEATRDDELDDSNGVQSGSAAAGGFATADGSDIRTTQTKNNKMSARSSRNLLKVIDIYSARVGLDLMEVFFRSDVPHRQSKIKDEEKE